MNIKVKILNLLRHFHWFRWYEYCLLNRRKLTEIMQNYQHQENGNYSRCKVIVCIHDQNYGTGGLADRLRGIVSAYQISKEHGIPFKIWWTHPFMLQRFLEPNEVKWNIKGQDVCWSVPSVKVISAEITEESVWQERKIHHSINKYIKNARCEQLHLYTNMRLSYEDKTFTTLFHELFKPSAELLEEVNKEMKKIGNGYIAVQCRFVGQLGDFKDNATEVMPQDEQQVLTDKILSEIKGIHKNYPEGTQVLICTDSPKFRQKACMALSYAYAVSGDILHIDYTTNPDSDAYMKLFTDFYLMSKAQAIYRIASEKMRFSGLPFMASLLEDRKLIDIKIK